MYLSQNELPDSDKLTELAITQYKGELEQKLKKGLRAFSYFSPNFKYSSDALIEWQTSDIILTVEKGRQTTVSNIDITHDLSPQAFFQLPTVIAQKLEQTNTLLINKALISNVYDTQKSRLQSLAISHGYFDFKWLTHKVEVSSKQASATIVWDIRFGKRYQFGALEFSKDDRGQALVESVATFKQGDWFTQEKLSKFSQRVRQTNYFDSVIVRPNIENKRLINEQLQVPIELLLTSKPKDSFRFGAGLSTDTGPRVTMNWLRPWVNLRGHSIASSAYISKEEQTADVSYTVPMANPLNDFVKYQLGIRNTKENQTDSMGYTFAIQRQFGAIEDDDWNKVGFIKYEYENFVQGFQEEQSAQLLLPGVSFNRVRKDDEIFVSNGDRQNIIIEGSSDALLSDIDIFRIEINTKWIRSFGDHRWIARADLGALYSNDFDAVPSSLRFFAGGDQSIRGFGLNEVGQQEYSAALDAFELIGGQYLNVASIEYAYSVTEDWRVAVFTDAGGAGEKFGDELAYGVGVGAHWLSPVGTIRLYLARGFSDEENNLRLHFSIGPGV